MNIKYERNPQQERIIETVLMPFLFCDLNVLMSRLIPGAFAVLKSMRATSDAHDDTFTKILSIPDENEGLLAAAINNSLRGKVDRNGMRVKGGALKKKDKPHHPIEAVVNTVYLESMVSKR